MDNEDKLTVFNILKNVGFYDKIQKIVLNSARMKHALYDLPKKVVKIQNPTLPAIEIVSDDLQGDGVEISIPTNKVEIYTRLENLLGLKLSGHTDTLTEASNLIDELYMRGEIQNEQQYRNALNNISTV